MAVVFVEVKVDSNNQIIKLFTSLSRFYISKNPPGTVILLDNIRMSMPPCEPLCIYMVKGATDVYICRPASPDMCILPSAVICLVVIIVK